MVAPTLTGADVDATTAFVFGDTAPKWLAGRPGRAALLVRVDGTSEAIGFQAR
ncbi:hypothetical protein NSZ01_27660 [Nocardioides szechwanensis]|nr:hypothetical protein NSZ01_27660 [Nocardioides szechwanensis]